MVNFLLLLFQKSLIFPFEENLCGSQKTVGIFFFSFFSTFGALFLCRIALEPAITMNTNDSHDRPDQERILV